MKTLMTYEPEELNRIADLDEKTLNIEKLESEGSAYARDIYGNSFKIIKTEAGNYEGILDEYCPGYLTMTKAVDYINDVFLEAWSPAIEVKSCEFLHVEYYANMLPAVFASIELECDSFDDEDYEEAVRELKKCKYIRVGSINKVAGIIEVFSN